MSFERASGKRPEPKALGFLIRTARPYVDTRPMLAGRSQAARNRVNANQEIHQKSVS